MDSRTTIAYRRGVFSDALRTLAYCWPQSVRSGETVGLHLAATAPTVTVEVVRDDGDGAVVWRGTVRDAAPHAVPDDAPEAGCGWPVSVEIPTDPSWPSGLYLVRCTAAGAAAADPPTAFFVVRAVTPSPDRILLVLATTTWNAYNDVGGRNLYTGATVVSAERPLGLGMLAKPVGDGERVAALVPGGTADAFIAYTAQRNFSMWHGMAGWAAWERRFVLWARAAGYRIDVAIGPDLETVPEFLRPYRLMVSAGHDEYWSAGMRDAVEAFVADGGNVAFLSGNTCYWQVRLEGSRLTCFKHRFREDPVFGTARQAETTTIWSDPLLGRPETQLTGVSFTRGGYARTAASVTRGTGGYEVHRPEHWLFAGTVLGRGDQRGAAAVVVGY